MRKGYYKTVGEYYDGDAPDFDHRYQQNLVLQKIRQQFREEVYRLPSKKILEVGFGTGLDMVHFAKVLPESQIYGIDISAKMVDLARGKAEAENLEIRIEQGSVEDISSVFPDEKFDLIYVFFGALNTVEDLNLAARHLKNVLQPGGKMVLTFVNKWYLAGMAIELLKLRPRGAFSRLRKIWGGYSPNRFLPSKCYTPQKILTAFSEFKCRKKRGFSIVHPAWYYHKINRKIHRVSHKLESIDKMLNRTPAWKWGEYTLFVFELPRHSHQHLP